MSVRARVSVDAVYHDTTESSGLTTLAVGALTDAAEYSGVAAMFSGTVGTTAVTITPTGFTACSRIAFSAGGRAEAAGTGMFSVTLRAGGGRVSVSEPSGAATTAAATIVVSATAQSTYSVMVLGG